MPNPEFDLRISKILEALAQSKFDFINIFSYIGEEKVIVMRI